MKFADQPECLGFILFIRFNYKRYCAGLRLSNF